MNPLQKHLSYSGEWNLGLQSLIGREVPYVMSNINKQLKKVCGKEPEMDKRLHNSAGEHLKGFQIRRYETVEWNSLCMKWTKSYTCFLSQINI